MATISTEFRMVTTHMTPAVAEAAGWAGSPSPFEDYVAHMEGSRSLTWEALRMAEMARSSRTKPSNAQPVPGMNRRARRASAARMRRS